MLQVISYGGGVQSTALLVLAALRVIDFRTFLFANVGDDSEHPGTLAYIRDVAAPYAARHDIDLWSLKRVLTRGDRKGETETLYATLMREGGRRIPIPVRMESGAPGTRSCTADFKIKVVGRWLKEHGATADDPATVGIGISLDEIERLNQRRAMPYERPVYPLLDHAPPLNRQDCMRIIADAGLPVPGKSSCWFCPYHRVQTWAEMRRDEPELFERAAVLEDTINERRAVLERDPVYLTRYGLPLRVAIPAAQDTLFDDDEQGGLCDNGVCFT